MKVYRAFLRQSVYNYLLGSVMAVIATGSLLMLSTLEVSTREYMRLLLVLAVSFCIMAGAELFAFYRHIRPVYRSFAGASELEDLRAAYDRTHRLPGLSVRRIMGPHLLGLSLPAVGMAHWMIHVKLLDMPYYYPFLALAGAVLIACMHALIEFFQTGATIVPLLRHLRNEALRLYGEDFSLEEHNLISIRPKFLISCTLIGTFPLFLFSLMTHVRIRDLGGGALLSYWGWAAVVLIMGTVFSLTAAWLLTRSVQQPIGQLYESMKKVKEGRLEQTQDYYSDEFSRLVAGFNVMVRGLQIREEQNQQLLDSLFTSLAVALDARDPYTAGHSIRVAEYSVIIGQLAGLKGEELDNLRKSALLHDIGKIGVRDAVLFKEGWLTEEEFDQIKSHPVLGENILRQIEPQEKMLPYLGGVRSHHERYDGKGYPDGLAGGDIPLFGRIIAVADAYDAMTSDRPYRKGMEHGKALKILSEGRGTQWDPVFAGLLLGYFEQNRSRGIPEAESGYAGDYPISG
ncbi:HD domain-containing protein [Paenibacillus spiritus]|uniref:HD domain-containing protein n=1 Tax=Paenibacillus spiritus TaxID=2496557 RepID=A0A5J5G2U1_9BACL|nr:HD domain-containing phosphohydrolase [Paenibacillus spiritus]KAA9001021.1 HD domain-containing protein [Paenibacillus spiritus]